MEWPTCSDREYQMTRRATKNNGVKTVLTQVSWNSLKISRYMYHVPAFPVINQRNKTKDVCFPAMESNESEKTEENLLLER